MDTVKKNHWSIPRTTSCLSNIRNVKHLETATNLITRFKRTGNVFIHLTGDRGLTLYSAIPKRFKGAFVKAFKRNPRALIGITKTQFVIHAIKVLDKYKLAAVITPFIALALVLSLLPDYLVWIILTLPTAYVLFGTIRVFKTKTRSNKKGE